MFSTKENTFTNKKRKNILWKGSQKEMKRCRSLLCVQNAFHDELQQTQAHHLISSRADAETEMSIPLPVGCLVWLQQALLSLRWCTLADAQLRAERSVSGPAILPANQGLHRGAGAAGGWGKVQQWNTANYLFSCRQASQRAASVLKTDARRKKTRVWGAQKGRKWVSLRTDFIGATTFYFVFLLLFFRTVRLLCSSFFQTYFVPHFYVVPLIQMRTHYALI